MPFKPLLSNRPQQVKDYMDYIAYGDNTSTITIILTCKKVLLWSLDHNHYLLYDADNDDSSLFLL